MTKRFIFILFAVCALLTSCKQKMEYTTVEIKDPVRHYYPILRGQELIIIGKLTNTAARGLDILYQQGLVARIGEFADDYEQEQQEQYQ